MRDAEVLSQLLESTRDYLLVLDSNREVIASTESFLNGVNGAGRDRDFMETVPLHARDRVLGQLVRAAAGDEVMLEVPHVNRDGNPFTVEYRFFPLDGGRVGAVGRPRGELPTTERPWIAPAPSCAPSRACWTRSNWNSRRFRSSTPSPGCGTACRCSSA